MVTGWDERGWRRRPGVTLTFVRRAQVKKDGRVVGPWLRPRVHDFKPEPASRTGCAKSRNACHKRARFSQHPTGPGLSLNAAQTPFLLSSERWLPNAHISSCKFQAESYRSGMFNFIVLAEALSQGLVRRRFVHVPACTGPGLSLVRHFVSSFRTG